MSGAAAISAAKNRRGGPPQQQQQQPPQQTRIQPPTQNKNTINAELPKPTNPLQALQLHEIRLGRTEKTHLELQQSIKTLSDLVEKQQQQPQQQIPSAQFSQGLLTQMNERLGQVEEMFHHLKEDIFRLQAFSMETNMAFLKYQAGVAAPVAAEAAAVVAVAEPTAVAAVAAVDNISLNISETS